MKEGSNMHDLVFNSEAELYERLLPALSVKKNECHRARLKYISEADIWNYLKQVVWTKASNLELANMVNDILTTDIEKLDRTLRETLLKGERSPQVE